MGFELVVVRLHGGSPPRLQVMAEPADHARPMTVDDCADISHAISALLDVADPIAGAYTLEVSSPGLDRPLVRRGDYERFKGAWARVETDLPVDGRRRFQGRLDGIVDDDVLVTIDEGSPAPAEPRRVRVPLAAVRRAKLLLAPPPAAAAPAGRARKNKGATHHGA